MAMKFFTTTAFVPTRVLGLVVLLLCHLLVTNGFVVQQRSTGHLAKCTCTPLKAKPPPTASFDLEAIEAFERLLERENSGADDGDEDLDDGLNTAGAVIKTYEIPDKLDNMRIDAAIAALEPELSRSFCGKLVSDGRVSLLHDEGRESLQRKSTKVAVGQILEIQFPAEEVATEIVPQDIPLDIIFEDEHMIVLNKAANMVVHPGAGNWDGTVVNALAQYLQRSPYGSGEFVNNNGQLKSGNAAADDVSIEGTDGEATKFRPGIVHRLDKGTTGVLVVAKTTKALATLSESFSSRNVKKTYLAVTVGNPGTQVTIDKPIGRHPLHRQRMRVVPDPHNIDSNGMAPKDRMVDDRTVAQTGRRALSYVDTLFFDGNLSLVQVQIATGRTHQIRVHLQDRHTPIYGDDVYGLKDWNKQLAKTHKIDRPLLHAYKLTLDHPVTGESMTFQAPLAADMLKVAKAIYPQGESERPDIFSS